jgi:DNA-binding transcriptional MerR regulator
MTWSTREIAHLAGTTVSTVRHYHQENLLDEPDRGPNGYKHYEVRHLVQLLRVRRLAELGMPLEQIAAVDAAGTSSAPQLRVLAAQLTETIARLESTRDDLTRVIASAAPTDLPPGFGEVAENMSDADRAMLLIYARVLAPAEMTALREMLEAPRTLAQLAFADLPPDADDELRERLARELGEDLRRTHERHPWTLDPGAGGPFSREEIRMLFDRAIAELYNPAQRDVLARLRAPVGAAGAAS